MLEDGRALFDGRKLLLQSRDGVMLPLDVTFGDVRIVWSTAEIAGVERDRLEFRLTQSEDAILLETDREIVPGDGFTMQREGRRVKIVPRQHAKVNDRFVLQFKV